MKKTMPLPIKIILGCIGVLIFTVLTLIPQTSEYNAHADMGPKPFVSIDFKNMPTEDCYATLLSERKSTGPHSAIADEYRYTFEENEEYREYYLKNCGIEVFRAFVEYEDPDGYYFLQINWHVSETKQINWNYYPPQKFKILLYYPEKNLFVTSEIYERYAFASYFSVDMQGVEIANVTEEMPTVSAEKNYKYWGEILSLICRILITLAVEILLALLFRLIQKKKLSVILITNVFTNVLLNIGLNIVYYFSGSLTFAIFYILSEFFVFVIESVVYCLSFKKIDGKPHIIVILLYTLLANALSFACGFLFGLNVPRLF